MDNQRMHQRVVLVGFLFIAMAVWGMYLGITTPKSLTVDEVRVVKRLYQTELDRLVNRTERDDRFGAVSVRIKRLAEMFRLNFGPAQVRERGAYNTVFEKRQWCQSAPCRHFVKLTTYAVTVDAASWSPAQQTMFMGAMTEVKDGFAPFSLLHQLSLAEQKISQDHVNAYYQHMRSKTPCPWQTKAHTLVGDAINAATHGDYYAYLNRVMDDTGKMTLLAYSPDGQFVFVEFDAELIELFRTDPEVRFSTFSRDSIVIQATFDLNRLWTKRSIRDEAQQRARIEQLYSTMALTFNHMAVKQRWTDLVLNGPS